MSWRGMIRLSLGILACASTLAGSSTIISSQAPARTGVTIVDAEPLIVRPGRGFDLEGQSIRFRPAPGGGYDVSSQPIEPFVDLGTRLNIAQALRGQFTASWHIALPFAFPIGGRSWTEMFVNLTGSVSFGRSELDVWSERDIWSDGTMRAVASALDARSAVASEVMIAALWGVYNTQTAISVDVTPARAIITWRGARRTGVVSFHDAFGENVFRAALLPSGEVILSFWQVAERDGIVGLFVPDNRPVPLLLDGYAEPGDAPHDLVDVREAQIRDRGTVLDARFIMGAPIPERIQSGTLEYRLLLNVRHYRCQMAVIIDTVGRRPSSTCTAAPRTVGFRVYGDVVELAFSKTSLDGAARVSWAMDVVWRDSTTYFDQVNLSNPRPLNVGYAETDLSEPQLSNGGSVYETFHFPVISRNPAFTLPYIYSRYPAEDDIAVLLTDFRIDDITGGGPSFSVANSPVTGINITGGWSPAVVGSSRLQVSMATSWIGARLFRPAVESVAGRYPGGVNWIAHESAHRWLVRLRWRRPDTGAAYPLTNDGCRCHWSDWLHTPSHANVNRDYAGVEYLETSPMDGFFWEEASDGTFRRQHRPLNVAPAGFSALDLYAMGLLGPEEVPDTFYLDNAQPLGGDRYRATKVPVRIGDIIAVEGPRLPAARDAQRDFNTTFYLLHEPGRQVYPEMLQRTKELAFEFARYMHLATDRRMRIVLLGAEESPAAWPSRRESRR